MKTSKLFTLLLLILVPLISLAGPNEDLVAACKVGDLAKATAAIAAGADVNHLEGGNSPLASAFFWPEVTKLLLDKGANPNLGDYTPLMQAASYYSIDVLKMLLDAGADPNKATMMDPSVTFKTLIANEKAKGKAANQSLIKTWEKVMTTIKPAKIYALQQTVMTTGCATCVEMLLAKGAKLDLGVTDGTLLHTFASANGTGKSKELWKQAFPAMQPALAQFGFTVFPDWYSADMAENRYGSPEQMLKLLLAKGLNINEKNKGLDGMKPRTPLEMALNTGLGNLKEVMLALINNGADVKVTNEVYGPFIFQATQIGYPEVVKAMLDKGADINAEGSFFGQTEGALLKGYTPLTIAAYKDNLELVKYLIGAGAKVDIGVEGKFFNSKTSCLTKVSDKTAIYYAIENGNVEMVKFMVDADVKWWKRVKVDQIKERSVSQGINGVGQGVIIYSTSCFEAGEYTPSLYVNAVTKNKKTTANQNAGLSQEQTDGLTELKAAMKAKGI